MNKTWVMSLVMLALLSGCNEKSPESSTAGESQVAALVNEGEVSVHQVETLLRLQPGLAMRFGEQASTRALDNLIEQELAAQAATQSGLDSSPQTLQALALARREVLARAYQDQVADKAELPDTNSIQSYYDKHPELFSERRQYFLEETIAQVPASEVDAWLSKAQSTRTVEEWQAWLAQQNAPHKSRRFAQWAEGMPMDLLPKLHQLPVGQSLAMRRPDSVYVLTVIKTEEAPVLLGQATPAIQTLLTGERRKEAVREAMTRLREQAKITRLMPLPASAASAPISPANQ